jgi:large exoprotein involved in heme utilization and adhesion
MVLSSPGKTLALVGGDVVFRGGNLTAPGGRIELGSMANNSLVSLQGSDFGYALGYSGVPVFRDIQLSGAACVDVGTDKKNKLCIQQKSKLVRSPVSMPFGQSLTDA